MLMLIDSFVCKLRRRRTGAALASGARPNSPASLFLLVFKRARLALASATRRGRTADSFMVVWLFPLYWRWGCAAP